MQQIVTKYRQICHGSAVPIAWTQAAGPWPGSIGAGMMISLSNERWTKQKTMLDGSARDQSPIKMKHDKPAGNGTTAGKDKFYRESAKNQRQEIVAIQTVLIECCLV